MTMMEVLVAMLIFTVVFLVALGLYQVANRAYLRTDAATIQQQNVRFAMDRMAETVRDAGANYNTLGANNVADEQVEGAWEAALFVRGDYDNLPETTLTSTTFPIVTTGNDEVVGYVLRKPGGDANNTITLTMKVDTSAPRNATLTGTTLAGEETVTVHVAAAALSDETDPPYQLTRVTFDSSGNPQYEVVAEDVFRLSFAYLNAASATAITTFGGADTERDQRAAVRQVDLNLIGMSSRPDPGFVDAAVYSPVEGSTTKNRRKLSLTQHIVPPNLGLKGKKHMSVPAITVTAPASITVCTGHCQYFGVSWPASSSTGVTTYKVHVTAPAGANPLTDPAWDDTFTVTGLSIDYRQPTSTARAYTFSVAATAAGTDSSYTATVSATSSNDAASVPSVATNVAAVQSAGANSMAINWDEVLTNTGPITAATCQTSGGSTSAPAAPWNSAAIDLAYYEVFRVRDVSGVTGSFTTGAGNRIDNQVIGTLVNSTPPGASFTDNTAAPCTSYYYRVQPFDYCNVASTTASAAMSASSSFDIQPTTVVPDVPGGTAAASTAVTGTTTSSSGNYNVTINWPPVVQTNAGAPAATAHYKIERDRKVAPAGTYSLDANFDVYETMTFSDVVPNKVSGNDATYQYYVRAAYDCASPRASAPAGPYTVGCAPTGTLTITTPAAGSNIVRPTPGGFTPTAVVTGTGWTSATATITGPGSAATSYTARAGTLSGSTFTFPTFDASNTTTYPDGINAYTISIVGFVGSCATPVQTSTFTLSTVTCGLQLAASPAIAYTSTNGNGAYTSLTFKITNTCTITGITVDSLKFTWSGVLNTVYINSISGPSGALASPASATAGGNGVVITFSSPVTIAANSTSGLFTIGFSSNFTSNGGKTGTPGKFSSIIAHETNVSPSNDELISGSPVP
jgi:hypothetical protein